MTIALNKRAGAPLAGLALAGLALAGLLLALACPRALAASAAASEQKIYLDPDTGEVVDNPASAAPTAEAKQRRRETTSAAPQADSQDAPKNKAWTNDEGADMITTDPGAAPTAEAVHCPDGSLRMGHARGADAAHEREALCAARPK